MLGTGDITASVSKAVGNSTLATGSVYCLNYMCYLIRGKKIASSFFLPLVHKHTEQNTSTAKMNGSCGNACEGRTSVGVVPLQSVWNHLTLLSSFGVIEQGMDACVNRVLLHLY